MCLPQAPSGGAGGDAHVEYVAFTSDGGSVSKMAVVRRRLARVLGRYLLGEALAAGGMATVHLGRLLGPAGFSRTVAVKRMHAHLAADAELAQRFIDEARIASRVRHTNVVQTLDVVAVEDELLLVMDYVHGESLARLRRLASARGAAVPPHVASAIVSGVLRGLHAAHESKSARGAPLQLVHRDVSPQNIMIGADGIARVLDFGIAKAAGAAADPRGRDPKGKLAYMAPEQLDGRELDRRADLFAAGVVLWEAVAGERLFRGEDAASTREAIHRREPASLAGRGLGVAPALDDVLARALAKDASERFETADAMARALEAALPPASDREVAEWVEQVGGELLLARAEMVAAFESDDTGCSVARLHAAQPSPTGSARTSTRSARRDALVPPPLESMTNEHTTLRGEAATLPTLEMEAEVALAATGSLPFQPAIARRGGRAAGEGTRILPPGSLRVEGVSEQRTLHTPLVMVRPSDVPSELPASGATRIEPVDRGARRRTPIPMPVLPSRGRRPASVWQLALLVVVPPILVAAALLGSSHGRAPAAAGLGGAAARIEPAAAKTPTPTPSLSPSPPSLPSAAPPPSPAPPPSAPDVKPKTEAGKRPERRTRPAHRPARPPPRPVPVAVDR